MILTSFTVIPHFEFNHSELNAIFLSWVRHESISLQIHRIDAFLFLIFLLFVFFCFCFGFSMCFCTFASCSILLLLIGGGFRTRGLQGTLEFQGLGLGSTGLGLGWWGRGWGLGFGTWWGGWGERGWGTRRRDRVGGAGGCGAVGACVWERAGWGGHLQTWVTLPGRGCAGPSKSGWRSRRNEVSHPR